MTATYDGGPDDPRFAAGMDMLRRTGMQEFQLRWDDDQQPVVWVAVAGYQVDRDGRPVAPPRPGRQAWKMGAGLGPVAAMTALLGEAIDGGLCVHCNRPTGVTDDLHTMPANRLVCWYQFDPELATYRRGCE